MAEWILTSSLLIVIVLAVRALFRGRMGLRLRYALWLLVLLRLLVPGTVFQTGLSVLNYVPLSQTAAVQAQPSQSGGSPSAPEAEPMPVRPEGEAEPRPSGPAAAPDSAPAGAADWRGVLTAVWLGGAGVLAAALLALVGVVAEYTRIVPEWVMLILFLVAFFLYGYCIKRAWKVARLVKRIRRRIRRHSGNNPKLTK